MHAFRWALLLIAAATPLAAQQRATVTLSGTVSDSVTGRPLGGAIVSLTGGARATRSDAAGQFAIAVPWAGEVILEARRIGYGQRRISVEIKEGADKVEVNIGMSRLATLDTVRVRASDRALYGVVGTAKDLQPLDGAEIELLGSGFKAKSDANGRFFIPIKGGKTFLVRARYKGFAPQMMSVTIPDTTGLEVALLLDSARGSYPKRMEMALSAFETRVKFKSNYGAMIPRFELIKNVKASPLFGLQSSPSFIQKGLRLGPTACIHVDGQPRPTTPLWGYDLSQIEMVEAYTAADYNSRQLSEHWPRGMPCSETGIAAAGFGGSDKEIVMHLIIWMKR
jgi:hypothetical protein